MRVQEFVVHCQQQSDQTRKDVTSAWCDRIGVPREAIRYQNPYEVWTEPTDATVKYFDYIPKTPNGVPREGDLVIFSQGVGPSGHISIATGKGDSHGFTSFDVNWAGVASPQLVDHTYEYVYGWLRKKPGKAFVFKKFGNYRSIIRSLVAIWKFLNGKKTIIIGVLMIILGWFWKDQRFIFEGLGVIAVRTALLGGPAITSGRKQLFSS